MQKKLYGNRYYQRGGKNFIYNFIISILDYLNLQTLVKNLASKDKVLEVGCGDGKVSRLLALNGFKIDAIDISNKAIEIAMKYKSKVNYICGDVFSLKARNNYYGAVYSLHVMEHIENIEDTLKEIYRIMKKGGKLIIRIPNSDSLEAKLAGNNWFHWDEPYHKHHWSSQEFRKLLSRGGFPDIKTNFVTLDYKQVLLYSCLNYLGIKTDNYKMKLFLLPFQLIFVPMSIVLGFLFKNSGTVEMIAEKH